MQSVDFQRQRPRMSVAEYVSRKRNPEKQVSATILMEPSVLAMEAAHRVCTARNIIQ